MKNIYSLVLIVSFFCTLRAQPDINVQNIVQEGYRPGDSVVIALECTIPDSFHLYGNPLGPGIGKPLSIRVEGSSLVKWFSARKMPAKKFTPIMGDWVWAYDTKTVFFIVGQIDPQASGKIEGMVFFDALICHNSCVPVEKKVPFSILTGARYTQSLFPSHPELKKLFLNSEEMSLDSSYSGQAVASIGMLDEIDIESIHEEQDIPEWNYDPVEKEDELNFILALFFAFCAGLLLNVMPCVLPVLGIKIISFSQNVKHGRKEAFVRSLIFSAGMISVFMMLAALAAFAGFSWGEQFQTPGMLVAIICIIVVFSLGMFDIYTIILPSGLSNMGQAQKGKGYVSEFMKGMVTTVMATPCSGPLLGATLAWTLRQPTPLIFMVFFALGCGMASPYVILSASKRISSFIPRPGTWMDDLKHIMGFFLFGFAVYLMIGLPVNMVLGTISLCLFLACAIMVYTRFAPFGSSWGRKAGGLTTALLLVLLGWHVSFRVLAASFSQELALEAEEGSISWKDFSPQDLTNAHMNGQHVIIDFTANWCMNCQYNKIAVLSNDAIAAIIKKKNVLALKADLTRKNPSAESLLHHLGSRSVPFLAIFPGDSPYEPVIMRDILNKKKVTKALRNLAGN